jgi:hypothetical protein
MQERVLQMKVEMLMEELGNLPYDAEVYVDTGHAVKIINRVEEDSQGVYILADQFITDQEEWK